MAHLVLPRGFQEKPRISLWTGGHRLLSATEGPGGFGGLAILIRQDFATAFNVTFLGSV